MAEPFGEQDKGLGGAAKRPAPTIEGTATEISVEPAPEPARDETETQREDATSAAASSDDAPQDASPPPPPRPPAARPRNFLTHMAAGLLGALIGVAASVAAWNALDLGPKPAPAPDLSGIEARLAKLESTPEPAGDADALAALDARLKKIEARPSDVTPEMSGLPERVMRLETAMKALAETANEGGSVADAAVINERIAEAERRLQGKIEAAVAEAELTNASTVQDIQRELGELKAKIGALAEAELTPGTAADQGDLKSLSDRIAKLESELPALQDALGEDAGETKAATLAIALANLRKAVDDGHPFANELATLKALAPTGEDLGTLPAYASKGIPTLAALRRTFSAAADRALTAAQPDNGGSLWDSLLASAQSLVKVRRVDAAAPGDGPDAVLARAGAKLETGDLASCVAEIEKLDGSVRAPFAEWLDQAHARLDAEHNLKRLEGLLLVSVGGRTVPPKQD